MMMAIRYYVYIIVMSICAVTSMSAQDDPVDVELATSFINGGNTVCVDVNVSGFDSMELFQFTLRWDPSVITYTPPYFFEFNNDTLLIDPNALGVNEGNAANGAITLQWLIPVAGDAALSLPDGSTILRFCFAVNGDPCSSTPIFISDNPTDIEFIQLNGISWTSADVQASTELIEVQGGGLTVFASKCDSSPGNDDGSIRFYPCGGTPPYSWTINGAPGTDPASLGSGEEVLVPDLANGDYTIVVTDANGNTASRVINIETGLGAVTFDLSGRDPNCFYRNNGLLQVNNVNSILDIVGTEWSNGEFNTDNIRNLSPGIYSVSLTDQLGCVTVQSDTLTVDTIRASFMIVDSAGCGGQPGVVSATASGGVPLNGSLYFFDGGFPTLSYSNAYPGGPFEILVADDVGCEILLTGEMPVRDSFSVDIATLDISCNSNVASLGVTASGPFQFDFDITNIDGSSFTGGTPITGNLFYQNDDIDLGGADSLQLIVTTTTTPAACQRIDTITLYGLSAINIEAVVDNPGCDGTTGSIDITATGGNEPYMYRWSDNVATEDRTAIGPDIYTVTVTDVDGCSSSATYEILPGGSIATNISIANPISCPNGDDGSLTAAPSPADDYSYTWSDTNGGATIAATQTVTDLSSGWYYLTVSSNTQNCVEVDSIFLGDGAPLNFNVTPTRPTCASFSDGSLAITVTNGVAPYTYMWADDPTMDGTLSLLLGLEGGQYDVTVSDARGCEVDTTLTLIAPNPISLLVTDIVNLDCSGQTSGEARATASGGAAGTVSYSYLWSSGEVGSGASHVSTQLDPGTQWVISSDGICVSDTIFFEVGGTPALSLSDATAVQLPACIDDCNGAIIAEGEGGIAPYTFTWIDDGSVTPNRTGLCAGLYIVEITDATGCQDIDSILLTNPDTLQVSIDLLRTVDLGCGDNLGQVAVAAVGGADGGYTYAWTGSSSTEAIAMDLDVGTYTATVTDLNGCAATASYTLSRPEELAVTLAPIIEPLCFGDMVCVGIESVTGGLGDNYTYQVFNGPSTPIDTCTMLFAGEISIDIFDESGRCSLDTTIVISQPPPVEVDAGPDIEIDLGEETDLISLDISSTSAISDISWTPAFDITCVNDACQTITIAPVADQSYNVVVTDANGCSAEDDLFVSVNTRRRVAFPNIFRPGSANNGTFQIGVGNGVENINYCNIYDRWGNLVWRQENYLPEDISIGGWDGTYRGKEASDGVYTVLASITFSDGVTLTFTESLTLIY
jgi:hypothetical protein